MAALVDGDDAELVAQFAGDVVPVVGVAALAMHEQEVARGVAAPVEVVDGESVDVDVVVGGYGGHCVLLGVL